MEDAVIIYAEESEDFQEYVYADGSHVKSGTPIGIEVFRNGKWKLILLHGIFYSNECVYADGKME